MVGPRRPARHGPATPLVGTLVSRTANRSGPQWQAMDDSVSVPPVVGRGAPTAPSFVGGPEVGDDVDVVVVGAGAAGTTAAIEAADRGARVLLLDRWGRGGASARSGGIVYAGGGTAQQAGAGFHDDPAQMAHYLDLEGGPAVDADVLRAFCEQSADTITWLGSMGITVPAGFDPEKSVTPTDDGVGLYFSGNERHFADGAPPVARGHRVAGRGMTGHDLTTGLWRAAEARGVMRRDGVRLTGLVVDDEGRVAGVDTLTLDDDPMTRLGHRALYLLVDAAAALAHRVPPALTGAVERWERAHGHPVRVHAPGGVILATGGFSYNHQMMAAEAPAYAGAMPLGTPGDDGSGIAAARALGAGTRLMDHCGASRFIAPPLGFCTGVLVDAAGERVCDESLYAATLSVHIAEHGGRAWLVLDARARREIRAQIVAAGRTLRHRLRDGSWADLVSGRLNHLLFPVLFGTLNLHANRVVAPDLDRLARRCGIAPEGLRRTIARYNDAAGRGEPDEFGKGRRDVRPLVEGPFAAVACHLDGLLFPAPCITLGGLDVDGATQQVRRTDGSAISGLYAVGRCAAGMASTSYVSGLSLADCLFSGRNAGRAVAAEVAPRPRRGSDRSPR